MCAQHAAIRRNLIIRYIAYRSTSYHAAVAEPIMIPFSISTTAVITYFMFILISNEPSYSMDCHVSVSQLCLEPLSWRAAAASGALSALSLRSPR